jgi:sugar (pentulose or hexulose) kinase
MDQSCAALGLGVLHSGTTAIGTGSVEAVSQVVSDTTLTALRLPGLPFSPYCDGKLLLSTISTFSAGSAIEWARSLLKLRAYDKFTIPASAAARPSPLLVIPHFAGAFSGQRDDRATAAIYGLTLKTESSDVARALIEGLTFELRLTLESLEAAGLTSGELRNGGGGSHSDSWLALKATVLNRPISRPIIQDSSCLGAAIHAAVGVAAFPSYDAAVGEMVHMARMFEPNPGGVEPYEERYRAYLTTRRQAAVTFSQQR